MALAKTFFFYAPCVFATKYIQLFTFLVLIDKWKKNTFSEIFFFKIEHTDTKNSHKTSTEEVLPKAFAKLVLRQQNKLLFTHQLQEAPSICLQEVSSFVRTCKVSNTCFIFYVKMSASIRFFFKSYERSYWKLHCFCR